MEAARLQNRTEIEVQDVSDWPEEKAISFMIADNRLQELAIMDNDLLSGLITNFDEPLNIPGVDECYLDSLIPDTKECDVDPDDVPDEQDAMVKDDEIWILGNHRLICGSSTIEKDIERLMVGNKADMIFTDPPFDLEDTSWFYNVEKVLNGHFFIYASEKIIIPFLTNESFCRLFTVDFRNANLVSNSVPFTRVDFIAEFKNTKTKFINTKDGFSTLIEMPKVKSHQAQNIGHPHQKKVELIELFLNHYTKTNDVILDAFLGSGTSLIACEKNNRKCYGIELQPKYCDIIIKRWETFTGKKAVLEEK